MGTRSEIDSSHSELDLRMTEGDPLGFFFWVRGAEAWASASFTCKVKQKADPSGANLAEPTVVVVAALGPDPDTEDIMGLNIDITNMAVPALSENNQPFAWAMKEVGGPTRFGGWLHVEPSPI